MHLIFTTETGIAKEKGKAYANPNFFSQLRSGVDRVTICGDYPAIVAAYEAAGVKVEIAEGASPPVPVGKSEVDIRKGPRGLFYVHIDGERASDGFATEDEARKFAEAPSGDKQTA